MTKINKKTEETNKTLALILAKLINPNSVHPDGFTTPFSTPVVTAQFSQFASTSSPIVTTQSTGIVQFATISSPITTTQSTSIVQFASTPSPIVSTQSTSIGQFASISSPIVTTQSTSIGQFASIPSPIVTTQSTGIVQFASISSPIVTTQCTSIGQFASISSPIVTTQSTSIVQFASISSPIVTTQSTSIGQFASIPSPIVTTQSTSIVQFASVPSPIVTTQSTSIMQYSVSANMELSPQPTPICAHFETVSSSVPQQSGIPISQSSSGILDTEKIKAVRSASCSRRNFSAKLVAEIFDKDTRQRSNVAGRLGKLKLNPVLIDYVKSLTFQFYPVQYSESEKAEWAKCVISIDESNRRKNKTCNNVLP